MRALEAFRTSAVETAPDFERSQDAASRLPAPYASQADNFAHPEAQSHGAISQDIPTLARLWPTNNNVEVSGFLHGLLFYGLGRTDLPSYPSGDLLLKAVTDEETAIRTFGKTPFVRTRNGLRYFLSEDPVFHSEVGEAHRDQCLATFAALDLPLDTPIHLKSQSFSVLDLLSESVASFSFDQHEPAWTAMAYAKYLPPKKEWANRFRERTSFSQLVHYLLHVDLTSQSCAGTHIFQALVKIHNADRRYPILDDQSRKELNSYFTTTLRAVVQSQEKDGGWNWQWRGSIGNNDAGLTTLRDRILVTGHILEVLNALGPPRCLRDEVSVHAAEWVRQSLNSPEIHLDPSLICPTTHAARSAREILEPSQTNGPTVADTFHGTE